MSIKFISCDPGHQVQIVFVDPVDVVFEDTGEQSQTVFAFPLAVTKYFRCSGCRISAATNTLSLQNRSSNMYGLLYAQNGLGHVRLTVSTNGQTASHDLLNVSKMTITANRIKVVIQSSTGSIGRKTAPEAFLPEEAPDTETPDSQPVSQPAAPDIQLIDELKVCIETLRQENQRLAAEKNAMDYALKRALGEQVAAESANRDLLSAELEKKLEAFAKVRAEEEALLQKIDLTNTQIRDTERQRDLTREKLQALESRLSALQAQEEAANLDCDSATRDVEELKIRLGMDSNVIELSESRWLKNNSIRDTMQELEQKISAIENRISVIINARELYNTTVQGAIMRENDGTIPMAAENSIPDSKADASGNTDLS